MLIARKLRPRETKVARSIPTMMLVAAHKNAIMIANIMTASDMMKVIAIVVDTITVKTSILVNMTGIAIIARPPMETKTIVTRIAKRKIMRCMQTSVPNLAHTAGVNCPVALAPCLLPHVQAVNGHSTIIMLIPASLMVLYHLLHTR